MGDWKVNLSQKLDLMAVSGEKSIIEQLSQQESEGTLVGLKHRQVFPIT